MAVVNPEKIANILAECAELYVLPRYKALKDHEISSKTGPRDLVTQADIDVEAHLERVLPYLLPGSVVVGEEGVSRGEMTVDTLLDDTQKIWIVDPVDGTYNFVNAKREFAIMLSCVIDGQTQLSWIYDVLGNTCAVTEKGSGAYWGGQRLQVAEARTTSDLIGYISPRFFPKEYRDELKQVAKDFGKCESLHCAAHEYLRIAKGEGHFSVSTRMKPWDHLAGALMVEEAGGHVSLWNGKEYTPSYTGKSGLITASNEDIWNRVFETFLSKYI